MARVVGAHTWPGPRIRVIQFGLGPIGRATLQRALTWRGIEVVGCVEQDQAAAQETAATVLADPRFAPVPIRSDVARLLSEVGGAEVVLHTAVSTVTQALPQLLELVDAGLNVITTTEELICPRPVAAPIVRRLGDLARRRGVTIYPTGVNPGFILDRLVLNLTSICERVDEVEGRRFVDATQRRRRLQEKLGVGGDPDTVRAGIAEHRFGHVGLLESLQLVGFGLGWTLDSTRVVLEPVVAKKRIERNGVTLEPGQVAGIHHEAWGMIGSEEVIHLVLRMSADVEEPVDEIRVTGAPDLEVRIVGGVAGDVGTVGSILNAVPYVIAAPPGFHSLAPSPAYWGDRRSQC
jgi:4-hydroxy-tetrahydrodipicolinate reductase